MVIVWIAIATLLGFIVGLAVGGAPTAPAIAIGLFVGFVGGGQMARRSRSLAENNTAVSGWRAVERELSRARRMERTFSLARVAPTVDVDAGFRAGLLGELRRSIRDIDASWWQGNEIFLLLSETSATQVSPLVARVEAIVPGGPGRWSVAEFPRDGLTVAALVANLAGHESASPAQLEVSDGAP